MVWRGQGRYSKGGEDLANDSEVLHTEMGAGKGDSLF